MVLGPRQQREMQLALNNRFEELQQIVDSIDARSASATVVEDQAQIFAAIQELPDGFDGLNAQMRRSVLDRFSIPSSDMH